MKIIYRQFDVTEKNSEKKINNWLKEKAMMREQILFMDVTKNKFIITYEEYEMY